MARVKRHFIPGYPVAVSGREKLWIGSLAVEIKAFIENGKARLRVRTRGRHIIEAGKGYQLGENL